MERTEGTTVGGQAPTHEGVEGSKEEMAPKLESKLKAARLRSGDEEMTYKVGNTKPGPWGSPGHLTWETEDGRGYPEGINALGQEGEEAEEQQAGCDHQEGQCCPELGVQDELQGQEQSTQCLIEAAGTFFHSATCPEFLPCHKGDHPPGTKLLGMV